MRHRRRTGHESMIDGYRNYLRWGHLVDDEGKPLAPDREDLLEQTSQGAFHLGGPEPARRISRSCAGDLGSPI